MPIRFVVAGTGWVAGEYVKAIQACSDAELAGMYSKNSDSARRKLAEHGAEARVYERFEDVVTDPDVDAVVLCAMPDGRKDQVVLAARHGKHLVIEKPLGLNRADLWAMADALREHPVRTVVSFVLRWNESFTLTKALIEDDALGRVYMAQIDYWHDVGPQYGMYHWLTKKQYGGSSMISAGCHAVDALRYFAGDIVEVSAYGCATRAHSDYEYNPNTLAILKLANGGIGKVSTSIQCATPYKFNVHLLGEKGTIMNNRLYSHKLPGQTDFATIPTVLPDNGDVSHHPFTSEIAEFVHAIRTNTPTRCDFFDAYKSMEVCFAVDESVATGKSVSLPLERTGSLV
ncbi:MAG: oxidoreductase [Paenibacillus sp.]|jgi:predicted dehydrogenase|nr:oxidoreductase [Paenibacillus sp.]